MRPFGFHVTILNTLDSLGKFDGKSDEGFFVGYSLSSKAFRVYNTRTKRVEENLHIGFLENKPMIEGTGPKWMFDIDSLTQSMNYVPVTVGTISNDSVGTSEEISQDCIVMLIWKDTSYFDSPKKDVENGEPKTTDDAQKQVEDGPNNENAELDKFEDDSSTKDVNVMDNMLILPVLMLILFFSDEDEPKVNLGNITNSYTVPTTPNIRIHKDHQIDNAIGDVKSSIQCGSNAGRTLHSNFKTGLSLVDCPCERRVIDKKKVHIEGRVYVTQPLGFKDPDHPDKVYKVYVDDIIFGSTNKELCTGFEKLMKDKFSDEFYGRKLTFFLGLQDSHLNWFFFTDSDYAGATQDRKSTTRDLLTKGFDAGRFQYLVSSIGMLNP
ncbi:putative ribonuclease H-like domain-containing protein [Tanacetum coccineum]